MIMQFSNLKLTNFRSHRSTEFALDRLNIIRGLNGAGKSSVAMALEFLMTGVCEITDKAGRGADTLISIGAKEFSVCGSLTSTTITRTRNHASSNLIISDGKKTLSGKVADEVLQNDIAAKPVLSAALNANRFLELSTNEQRDLLADALAAEPVAIPSNILKLFSVAIGHYGSTTITDLAQIDALYKTVYEHRTAINRELKALGSLNIPTAPEDMPTLDEVREKIRLLDIERDDLLRKIAKKNETYDIAKRDYDKALADKVAAEKDLLTDDQLEAYQKVARNASRAAKVVAAVEEAQRIVKGMQVQILKLKAAPTECPTCHRPYEDDGSSQAIEQMEAEYQQAEQQLREKQEELRKLGDPIHATAMLEAHKAASAKLLSAQAVISTGLPTKGNTAELDMQLAEVTARIAREHGVKEHIIRYDTERKSYEQQQSKRSELEKKLIAIEELISAFGPNSALRTQLVGDKLPAFVARINEVLERFGFCCVFSLNPYNLLVSRNGQAGLSLAQLSRSEQYRFALAFQIALAEATGVGLVVIDEADLLIPEARRQLSQELMESRLEQAFVLCTADEDQLAVTPEVEGVAFFNLENDNGVTKITNGPKETVYEAIR